MNPYVNIDLLFLSISCGKEGESFRRNLITERIKDPPRKYPSLANFLSRDRDTMYVNLGVTCSIYQRTFDVEIPFVDIVLIKMVSD